MGAPPTFGLTIMTPPRKLLGNTSETKQNKIKTAINRHLYIVEVIGQCTYSYSYSVMNESWLTIHDTCSDFTFVVGANCGDLAKNCNFKSTCFSREHWCTARHNTVCTDIISTVATMDRHYVLCMLAMVGLSTAVSSLRGRVWLRESRDNRPSILRWYAFLGFPGSHENNVTEKLVLTLFNSH